MLYTYSTEELIGLQDLIIERIKSNEKEIHIYGKLTRKAHCCPNCLAKTDKIHDYREQIIKDIPVYGKAAYIHLQKRRYRCQCGKRFYEKNIFLPRYHRRTNRLSAYIIDRLRKMVTFTDVGKEVNLSTTTIMRTFDLVSYSPRDLPTTLSIDEFKGNTNKEKYQCIITDPVNKTVLDILPKRYESYLTTYFLGFEKSKRDKVTAFVSDMWKPYSSLATKLFNWAFDGVRKDIQKELGKDYRIYFKHSRKLLFKRFNELDDEQKQQVNVMLALSPTLYTAHFYKEDFLKILDCNDRDSAKSALSEWINCAFDCGIERFKKCAQTMINWMTGILNSFSTPVTNGFTEGCNNKIKVLKRIAFGYQNFHRFRNRILHIFANQFS